MIKIGCRGFAAAQSAYLLNLKTVEFDKFRDKSPRTTTVDRWKASAPEHFDFVLSVKTFDRRSFDRVYQASSQLKTKILFFELPAQSAPNPDIIGKMQNFFKSLPKTGAVHVWQTPIHWPMGLIENFSKSLSLVPSTNPLLREFPFKTPLNYFRLGRSKKIGPRPLVDTEFSLLKRRCLAPNSYVIFNNGPYAYKDAVHFSGLVQSRS